MKSVDVVIPCYNYARYLHGCVQSVLSQPNVDVRVLIIDDASSDESAIVGRDLAAEHKNVAFRSHAINRGHIATYNEGLLDWSRADYAVLLSADDLLAPGSLYRSIQIMEADKSIGMVYGPAVHFKTEAELPIVNAKTFKHTRWSGADWLETRCKAGYNVITSPEVVVRGTIQRKVGGYNPALPHAGDLEMWLRIAAISNIAYVRAVPQAFYRVHNKSMMRTAYKGSFVDLRQRKDVFDTFFKNHRSRTKKTVLLQQTANRALAKEALWDACRAYDADEVELREASALEEFAIRTYAAAKVLPEYAALQRRRRLGPKLCHQTQVFAAPAMMRKVRHWALKRHLKQHGV